MKGDSEVVRFVGIIYAHGCAATGHSWRRLNGALRSALFLAVSAGMKFMRHDIEDVYKHFKGQFWYPGEGLYTHAVNEGNRTAAISYELFVNRKPFIWEGRRLAEGSQLWWKGEWATISSFGKEAKYLNALTTHWGESEPPPKEKRPILVGEPPKKYDPQKKRFKITREDLRAAEKKAVS